MKLIVTLVAALAVVASCAPAIRTLQPHKPSVLAVDANNGLRRLSRAEAEPNGLSNKMANYADRCVSGAFAFPVKTLPYVFNLPSGQQSRGFFVVRAAEDGSVPEEHVLDGTADAPGKIIYRGVIAFNANSTTIFEQGIGTLPGIRRAQEVFRNSWGVTSDYEGRSCPQNKF